MDKDEYDARARESPNKKRKLKKKLDPAQFMFDDINMCAKDRWGYMGSNELVR